MRIQRIPFQDPVVLAMACALAGCAGMNTGGGSGPGSGAPVTASSPLLEVYVPGSVRNVNSPSSQQPDPLLDPRTRPAALVEPEHQTRQCSPGRLNDVNTDRGQPLADPNRFDQLMSEGIALAQDRHDWRFHNNRLNRQQNVVNGFASRMSPEVLERLRREDEIYQDQLEQMRAGRATAPPRSSGNNSPTLRIRPFQIGRPVQQRPIMHTVAHSIPRNLDELRYNAEVLAAQNDQLTERERAHGDQLLKYYGDALAVFNALPSQNTSLADLNRLDRLRTSMVEVCSVRGNFTAQARTAYQAMHERYTPLARNVLATTRQQSLKTVNATKSSSELNQVTTKLFSTPFIRDLVEQDAQLAQGLKTKTQTLLAQEERAREERLAQERLQAERALAAQRQKYLNNAAKNVAPTLSEVQKLVTTYIFENTIKRRSYGRVNRIDDHSFEFYSSNIIFGEIRVGEFRSEIDNLICKPEGGFQRCGFIEKYRTYRYDNLGIIQTAEAGLETGTTHDVIFNWTPSGLESKQLKKTISGAGLSLKYSSGGPAGSTSNNKRDDLQDQFMERSIENRQNYDNKIQGSGGSGAPYDPGKRY